MIINKLNTFKKYIQRNRNGNKKSFYNHDEINGLTCNRKMVINNN